MKKFGTPIGAAPGVASEKVGLVIVGAPSVVRPLCFLLAFLRAAFCRSPVRSLPCLPLPLMLPARVVRLPLWRTLPVEPVPWAPPPWAPSVRLGAPGVLLPSGVGVEGAGSLGVGTGGVVALGVGTETGPLSMT